VRVGLGTPLRECGFGVGLWPAQHTLIAAKAPVFSMSKLTQVDTYLGPEMKSTGEVMGLGATVGEALGKALLAAGSGCPAGAAVLLSLADRDKHEAIPLIHRLAELGCDLLATEGTARFIQDQLGLPVHGVTKMLHQGHPNVLDVIASGRVGAVVNTVTGDRRPLRDGFVIRRAAVERRIPCFTSLDTLRAALDGLAMAGANTVRTVGEYRATSAQTDGFWPRTAVPAGHIVGAGLDEVRAAPRRAPRPRSSKFPA
jgi:carbamoyl-phosphate synthase large subunit